MPTYYEILKIQPTATQQEVESAVDTQYNRCRRLVTHHDPIVVEQATEALRTLELIRNTLGNEIERSKYNSSLNVGGLADPEKHLRGVAPSPLAMGPFAESPQQKMQPQMQVAQIERVDAWVCAKCKMANAIGENFCTKCGNQIADACPKCKALTELSKPFCSKCGADKTAVILALKNANICIIQQAQIEIQEILLLAETIPWFNFDSKNPALHKQIWGNNLGGDLMIACATIGSLLTAGIIGFSTAILVNKIFGSVVGWAGALFALMLVSIIIFLGIGSLIFIVEKKIRLKTTVRQNANSMIDTRKQRIIQLQQQIRQI